MFTEWNPNAQQQYYNNQMPAKPGQQVSRTVHVVYYIKQFFYVY